VLVAEELRKESARARLDGLISNPVESFISASYPSPPPSVVASVSSKISSQSSPSQRGSPMVAQATVNSFPVSSRNLDTPPTTPEQRNSVKWSERGKPIIHGGRPASSNRAPAVSESSDWSPIDEKWGVLFDPRTGYATERLGQFTRGLAKYIVTISIPTDP
jgi:hypothetical protein